MAINVASISTRFVTCICLAFVTQYFLLVLFVIIYSFDCIMFWREIILSFMKQFYLIKVYKAISFTIISLVQSTMSNNRMFIYHLSLFLFQIFSWINIEVSNNWVAHCCLWYSCVLSMINIDLRMYSSNYMYAHVCMYMYSTCAKHYYTYVCTAILTEIKQIVRFCNSVLIDDTWDSNSSFIIIVVVA